MGNVESADSSMHRRHGPRDNSFPGSALLDNIACGSVDDTDSPRHKSGSAAQGLRSYKVRSSFQKILNQADALCASSPMSEDGDKSPYTGDEFFDDNDDLYDDDDVGDDDDEYEELRHRAQRLQQRSSSPPPRSSPANPTSALFARALVNEVTGNPKTMTPAAMAEREKRLLKAQERARMTGGNGAVGAPGGIGKPNVMSSIAHALTGDNGGRRGSGGGSTMDENGSGGGGRGKSSVIPPNSLSENRAQVGMSGDNNSITSPGKHTVTIGLSLSRRHSTVGHADTVTRQTAFDFNELQDRQYKYVSSTDSSGWRAGGGERGGPAAGDDGQSEFGTTHKIAAPDTVHIPIIHIDASSPQEVDTIISALASGEVFIPHMSVLPEALGVSGVSPPDLVIRFGAERNDDIPPDEWPNWCLEFMHNQLYEYFHHMGARWMKRPFSITLAKRVRWKTVKHMNKYFSHAERVIDAWREKGPQYLDPQLAYIEGGATPEEVARPHGIYLLRNGVPTNYFAPNFDPPYTTKMTRSLLLNVLGKSWDRKRREWTSEPVPRLLTPSMLLTTMCGCSDNAASGFIANEVTDSSHRIHQSNFNDGSGLISSASRQLEGKENVMSPVARAALEENSRRQRRSITGKMSTSEEEAAAASAISPRRPPSSPATRSTSSPNRPLSSPRHQNRQQEQYDVASQQASSDDESQDTENKYNVYGDGKDRSIASTSPRSRGSPRDRRNGRSPSSPSSRSQRTHRSKSRSGSRTRARSSSRQRSSHSRSRSRRNHHRRRPDDSLSASSGSHGRVDGQVDYSHHSYSNRQDLMSPAGQPSVTGTNSTILHMNLANKFMSNDVERRQASTSQDEKKEDDVRSNLSPAAANEKADRSNNEESTELACDDDWLDDTGNPVPTPIFKSLTKSPRKQHQNRNEDRSEDSELQTNNESEQSSPVVSNNNSRSSHQAASSVRFGSDVATKSRRSSPHDRGIDTGGSLEYSVGDSTLLGDASTLGGSTLLGQHYATDTSVSTRDSRGSRLQKQMRISQRSDDDGSRSEFSLQESSSSLEVVPTDEELFAVGWAKALDPKSGSYYYFTLDRSKIVWDNPLAPKNDGGESVDSSLNSGALVT